MRPEHFARLAGAIDPTWIDDAQSATGTATVRCRKLPAQQVVWLAIGMGMFRDRSIAEVVDHLDLVLPAAAGRQVTSSAPAGCVDMAGVLWYIVLASSIRLKQFRFGRDGVGKTLRRTR